jgi:hypothetical protein
MSGFSLRGMMKMMSKGFKGEKGSFDCSSVMKDMMHDENGDVIDCSSMMGEMMKDENGKPIDCPSMMEAMTGNMSDNPFDCCSKINETMNDADSKQNVKE